MNTNNEIHKIAVNHAFRDGAFTLLAVIISVVPLVITDQHIASIAGFFGLSVVGVKTAVEIFRKLRTLWIERKSEATQALVNTVDPSVFSEGFFAPFGISDPNTFVARLDELSAQIKQAHPVVENTAPQINLNDGFVDPMPTENNYVYPTV